MFKKITRIIIKNSYFICSILLSASVNLSLFKNHYSNILIIFWLLAIIFFIFSFKKTSSVPKEKNKIISGKFLVACFFILLPCLVRIMNYDLTRIHGDDMLTGYYSTQYNFSKDNFFAPMPQKGVWVCQFPSLFFASQKLFFLIFGENLLTIKLSILPYVWLTSLLLFIFVNKFFNYKTAIISLVFYAFMAPSIYLETLGLEFISSTAIFLAYLYFEINNIKDPSYRSSIFSGLFCGLSLLFYTASYIAVPLFFVFFVVRLFKRNFTVLVKQTLVSIVIFLITTSPFFMYMYVNKNFYLSQRAEQVNIINGSWSGTKEKINQGENYLNIVKENSINTIKSFYQDGLSGVGGYNFGHMAFFDKFTFIFLSFGLIISLILLFKKIEILYILISIFSALMVNVVFTIPPIAFHRLSVVFPLIIIILCLPFYLIFTFNNKLQLLSLLFIVPIIIISSINNQKSFLMQVESERNNSSLFLAKYLAQNYPNRNVYVAAFPGFALDKILYFALKTYYPNNVLGAFSENKILRKKYSPLIRTEYHATFLTEFNQNEKYLYVYIFPDSFDDQFLEKDKKGQIDKFSDDIHIFSN